MPGDSAPFALTDQEGEGERTEANETRLAIVAGTDRDRSMLRSIAAAALGFIDAGMLDDATAILRSFLRST